MSIHRVFESQSKADVAVVFLHGLNVSGTKDSWRSTWRHDGLTPDDDGWPKWLGEELEKKGTPANVYAVEYPASASDWIGTSMALFHLAGLVLEELDLDTGLRGEGKIYFICYSLGGLVLKKMLSVARTLSDSKKAVVDRTKGIVFLSTPHQGAKIAGVVNFWLKPVARPTVTMEELESVNPGLQELYHSFGSQAKDCGWTVFQYGESKPTSGVLIVDQWSSHSGVGEPPVVLDEDHVSICKPSDKTHIVFRRILRIIAPHQAALEPTQEELDQVYKATVEAIEASVGKMERIAKFFGPEVVGASALLMNKNGQWTVASTYRSGGADVCPLLACVKNRLSDFTASSRECDALEAVIGGISVLGINPRWVWEQRESHKTAHVTYPDHADAITIPDIEKVQFLGVLLASLVGGCARLERVFGNLDNKIVCDLPSSQPAVTQADQLREMKRHFIHQVLGPSTKFDVQKLDDPGLERHFADVREILWYAASEERDPYVTYGERMKKVVSDLRQHAELSDLYLLAPAPGSARELMTHPIRALRYLWEIHKIIQQLRPSS